MPFQRPKFQKMFGGACPRPPLELCRRYGLPLTKILATLLITYLHSFVCKPNGMHLCIAFLFLYINFVSIFVSYLKLHCLMTELTSLKFLPLSIQMSADTCKHYVPIFWVGSSLLWPAPSLRREAQTTCGGYYI